MTHLNYDLRVIWACMKKEIQSALTQRIGTTIGVILPVNFLILMSLFAITGGQAPTAVVMHDTGPYARAFYDAMAHAHSFRLQTASAKEAQGLIQAVFYSSSDLLGRDVLVLGLSALAAVGLGILSLRRGIAS